MPNGLAIAVVLLILCLVLAYITSLLLSLIISPSHTKRKDLKKLVKSFKLKKGDVFADLGCGDGRVVFEVAKQYKDVKCIGYEISPIHIMLAKLSKTIFFPFQKRIQIIPEDFTKTNLDGINFFFINWGNFSTPYLEDFKKSLKKKKGVKVKEG